MFTALVLHCPVAPLIRRPQNRRSLPLHNSDSGAIDLWPCFSPDGKTSVQSELDKEYLDLFCSCVRGTQGLSSAPLPVSATPPIGQGQSPDRIHWTGIARRASLWLINADGTDHGRFKQAASRDRVFYRRGIRRASDWSWLISPGATAVSSRRSTLTAMHQRP